MERGPERDVYQAEQRDYNRGDKAVLQIEHDDEDEGNYVLHEVRHGHLTQARVCVSGAHTRAGPRRAHTVHIVFASCHFKSEVMASQMRTARVALGR